MTSTLAMFDAVWKFFRNCGRSRVGWLLVCLHGAWFLLAIANMSPPSPGLGAVWDSGHWSSATLLAGRPLHWHYESAVLKCLILVDMPAMIGILPVSVLLIPLRYFHVGFYVTSYFQAALLLAGASVQWLVVGNKVAGSSAYANESSSLRQVVDRAFGVLIAIIVAGTLILTPMVNQRSRSLGFRHGGISYR